MSNNRLTLIELTGRADDGSQLGKYSCTCGVIVERRIYCVTRNQTRSCGCLKRETSARVGRARKIHGDGNKCPEHWAWAGMLGRCYNIKNKDYANYGGRGITVCDRWRHSYVAFLDDVGRKPSNKHSLDRIDNNGSYSPTNCRWATRTVQSRNRRTARAMETEISVLRNHLQQYESLFGPLPNVI